MGEDRGSFVVITKMGELTFLPCPQGLATELVLIVETVHQNFEGFIEQDVEKAIGVQCLQGMLGNPSNADFLTMVHAFLNCDCTIDNCKHATKIFGKNLPNVVRKIAHRKLERVIPEYTDIPEELIKENRLITLVGDICS